ncbi:hypothetical protein M8C21_026314 [Ambrosia artemisiifolia]|uniref:Uncharacterized protein n=1 Tax=Ambrosia artemisiifolia TaxID=4212 RepID=A0AAD5CZF3_AMBAR|nr:hypothetical protein M8C21_026314 [Ambrosia artemisiifolia]
MRRSRVRLRVSRCLSVSAMEWEFLKFVEDCHAMIVDSGCRSEFNEERLVGRHLPVMKLQKKIIKLCHAFAETINNDDDVSDLLKLVFIPDYNVF